jgi:hypothetical protein
MWLFMTPGTWIHSGIVEKHCRSTFDLVEGARLGYVYVVLNSNLGGGTKLDWGG